MERATLKPRYDDGFAQMFVGDAIDVLSQLPEKSVHCVVTSPPYFGLRAYLPAGHPDKAREGGTQETPEAYVEWLVQVFRSVWKLLRDDGTLWLNLGDSYARLPQNSYTDDKHLGMHKGYGSAQADSAQRARDSRAIPPGLKAKDLLMIPARVALALQADGWYLRSQIVWCKNNPMPESVTDRPTQATEMVYLFSKKPRYFFDAEAVKETLAGPLHAPGNNKLDASRNDHDRMQQVWGSPSGRNLRNYWQISTRPYPGSHYATFPPELPERCIKAGTSERGVCSECGAPYVRVVERERSFESGSGKSGNLPNGKHGPNLQGGGETLDIRMGPTVHSRTIGFEPTCSHRYSDYEGKSKEKGKKDQAYNMNVNRQRARNAGGDYQNPFPPKQTKGWERSCGHEPEIIPATVLDPFSGSGTSLLVARKLGRKSIGIDIDERNVKLLEERLVQGVLL